jgi:nicotinamide riboside transporter PnuC
VAEIETAALHHLVTGALYLQQLQLLAAAALAWLANNPDEALATASGLLGAFLLARKGKAAAYGWIAFLASNAAWLWFAWRAGHPGLFVQQIGFSITSCMGLWVWLIKPAKVPDHIAPLRVLTENAEAMVKILRTSGRVPACFELEGLAEARAALAHNDQQES